MTRCQGIRRNGFSGARSLLRSNAGGLTVFWELKLKPWDIAAGALIVAEAGGQTQRLFRQGVFDLGRRDISFERHHPWRNGADRERGRAQAR